MGRKIQFESAPRRYIPPPKGELVIRPPLEAPGTEPEFPYASLISSLSMGFLLPLVILVATRFFPSLPLSLSTILFFVLFPVVGAGTSFVVFFFQKRMFARRADKLAENYHSYTRDPDFEAIMQAHQEYGLYLARTHPPIENCRYICEARVAENLWARRRRDPDFLALRIGIGEILFPRPIAAPKKRDEAGFVASEIDEVHKIIEEKMHRVLKDAPIAVSLASTIAVGIAGEQEDVANLLRVLIIQMATHHSPESVQMFLLSIPDKDRIASWGWARWLPHVQQNSTDLYTLAFTEPATRSILDTIEDELQQRQFFLAEQTTTDSTVEWPHLFIVVENTPLVTGHSIMNLIDSADSRLGATFIFTATATSRLPQVCRHFLEFDYSKFEAFGLAAILYGFHEQPLVISKPDLVVPHLAERISRSLAGIVLKSTRTGSNLPQMVTPLELLAANGQTIRSVADINLEERWNYVSGLKPFKTLAAPVGKRGDGRLQWVDIHRRLDTPTVDRGHGPHAIIAGSTGSGKSQLVLSLILSMAVYYRPDEVNFVIVDFKPPGLDKVLAKLPHVKNFTDISDLDLVPRALESLAQEHHRRSELFKAANVNDIDDYIQKYRAGEIEKPLPYLLLLVDEFATLRHELPDQMDKFEQIAMRGRAYGFLMVLIAQAPPITQQVATNTFLRLCLKSTPDVSNDVLGTPDAANLKRAGTTIMRVGAGEIPEIHQVFQSAYAEAPYILEKETASVEHIRLRALSGQYHSLMQRDTDRESKPKSQLVTITNYVVQEYNRLKGPLHIGDTERPWEDALNAAKVYLAACRADRRRDQGWHGEGWLATERTLAPIIGLVDDPRKQRQYPLELDFKKYGHVLICCNNNADRRIALHATLTSLMLDHSPSEVYFYGLDFGNYNLYSFRKFPHVGSVIRISEKRRLKRFFKWIAEELEKRKRLQIARAAIFVVIDNLEKLAADSANIQEYEVYRSVTAQLADEGPDGDIYLIVTTTPALRGVGGIVDKINRQRLCLRLNKDDYRTLIETIPDYASLTTDVGRGLMLLDSVKEVQVATLVQAEEGNENKSEQTNLFLDRLKQAMSLHCSGGQYRLPHDIQGALPESVPFSQFALHLQPIKRQYHMMQMLLGMDDENWGTPIFWNLLSDGPHFEVTGPTRAGKTTALRTMIKSLEVTCLPEELRVIVVDSFKGKLDALKTSPFVTYVKGLDPLKEALIPVIQDLEGRRQAQVEDAWPRYLVVMDDFSFLQSELKEDTPGKFMNELADYARSYHYYGLHFLVATDSSANIHGTFIQTIRGFKSICLIRDQDLSNSLVGRYSSSQSVTWAAREADLIFPGRAFVLTRGSHRIVQIAQPD